MVQAGSEWRLEISDILCQKKHILTQPNKIIMLRNFEIKSVKQTISRQYVVKKLVEN